MREIVFDTETTGFDPFQGDRIIEIGAVELINHIPTGKTCQLYINPERDVPAEAVAVHGITNDFLADKPVFAEVYSDFLDFIGDDSKLVAHNAEFDMKFMNYELESVGTKALPWSRVIDSLAIARKKFPGSPASLDALCKRFEIDNSNRTYHGALLDSELLAEVYLELLGGRQRGLSLSAVVKEQEEAARAERPFREPRVFAVPEAELAAHQAMVEDLGADAVWEKVKANQA